MPDEHTAVGERREQPMIDVLEALDCEVTPVAFDRVYPFGELPLLHHGRSARGRAPVVFSDTGRLRNRSSVIRGK